MTRTRDAKFATRIVPPLLSITHGNVACSHPQLGIAGKALERLRIGVPVIVVADPIGHQLGSNAGAV